MKKAILLLMVAVGLFAGGYTMAPDGTYVGGSSYHMAPNGQYVSGSASGGNTYTPNGTVVGGSGYNTTPSGKHVSGNSYGYAPNGKEIGTQIGGKK